MNNMRRRVEFINPKILRFHKLHVFITHTLVYILEYIYDFAFISNLSLYTDNFDAHYRKSRNYWINNFGDSTAFIQGESLGLITSDKNIIGE